MAMVTSELGLERELQLLELFPDPIRLLLLFKGSQHGFSTRVLLKTLGESGSGKYLILVYLKSGLVRGVYLSSPILKNNQPQSDENTFLFAIDPGKKYTFPVLNHSKVINLGAYPHYLYLGSCLKFYDNKNRMRVDMSGSDDHYTSTGWDEEIQVPYAEVEVHQVLGRGSGDVLLKQPWRRLDWAAWGVDRLMKAVLAFKPACQYLKQVRVLLLGPKGAGKSCFVNSVRSMLYRRVTHFPLLCSAANDSTWKLKSYNMKSQWQCSPLTLVDAPAVGAGGGPGLDVSNIQTILNGHALEGYKFETNVAILPTCEGYRQEPTINDKIHCAVFVLSACHILTASDDQKQTLQKLRTEISDFDIPLLVVLTHLDKVCATVQEDLKHTYFSRILRERMEKAADLVGLPVSYILPIKNYSSEMAVNNNTDILLLNAIKAIFHAVDDLFDGFHPMVLQETSTKNSSEKPVTVQK